MLTFANFQLVQLDFATRTAKPLSAVEAAERAAKYAAARGGAPAAPKTAARAPDSISVDTMLLDLNSDHAAAFSALGKDNQDRIIALAKEGKITASTVSSAMHLCLASVRSERWENEILPSRLTPEERKELDEVEAALRRIGNPDPMALMRRQWEIRMGVTVDPARPGLPIPPNHPGLHFVSSLDLIENQRLKDNGVNVADDPEFEQRLIEKLRSGEIGQISRR
ncbi:hypothetical protein [Azospirillum soli]|uniref:hypothetical protein n=1 Tax=Azospirillum soli TaxID=1304799 RepID=UPI001AE4A09D|nr:hypothetical protein [Azospirillum soli]MBP2313931.1 hypothetical protein [Azospirillum soli]